MHRAAAAPATSRASSTVTCAPRSRLSVVRNAVQCRRPAQNTDLDALGDAPASASVVLTRRHTAAAALLAAASWAAPLLPAGASGTLATGEEGRGYSKANFYAEWPYISPSDILPYLRATARAGDIDSVLAAIDRFAEFYPMYRCGPEKGAILEQLVSQQQPALALELGTFMGYGAARIARQLPPGGRLVSIEASEEQAAVARQVLEFAGVAVGEGPEARVQVVNGLSGDVLPRLRQLAGLREGQTAGFVFLDHCKPCYLPDLLTMERLSLLAPGTLVVADNVLIPGAPDYLQHVGGSFSSSPASSSGSSSSNGGSSSSRSGSGSGGSAASSGSEEGQLAYKTELRYTAFEVEERYKKDYSGPKRDAMSVSLLI